MEKKEIITKSGRKILVDYKGQPSISALYADYDLSGADIKEEPPESEGIVSLRWLYYKKRGHS